MKAPAFTIITGLTVFSLAFTVLPQGLEQKMTVANIFQTEQMNENLTGYPFGNPAGCAAQAPIGLSGSQLVDMVQVRLGAAVSLAERRQTYIWNGPLGSYLDVSNDRYAFEFEFNAFQHPLTYRGDEVATIFQTAGFVVWFRSYGDKFRILAVAMLPGVMESPWASYVSEYWQAGGLPQDQTIYPVMKKLPCRWVIENGFATSENLLGMFNLNWNLPDYLSVGQQYLSSNCSEANKVSQEKLGYWTAASVCGPLAWALTEQAGGFPYRIGSWNATSSVFISANPKINGQPWGSFDPETFDVFHTDQSLPGYDFEKYGNLFPGDMVYSYSTLYVQNDSQWFDHIFLVAGLASDGTRISISNMVRNFPYKDCSIEQVSLYTPGNRSMGVVNSEWNGNNFGSTGTSGFDIFRWKWVTYHINGQSINYTVRWGETLETIGYDWKVSPLDLQIANNLPEGAQLQPGQTILLPAPLTFEMAQSGSMVMSSIP